MKKINKVKLAWNRTLPLSITNRSGIWQTL